ncbi:hypothetical protein [Streptomyces sp. NPDC048644]|uniref:hypothetical protein n=1 Tax=Streptomyces sp. NPDC048644 TaxID=3365582 RepID=UPI0037112EA2
MGAEAVRERATPHEADADSSSPPSAARGVLPRSIKYAAEARHEMGVGHKKKAIACKKKSRAYNKKADVYYAQAKRCR